MKVSIEYADYNDFEVAQTSDEAEESGYNLTYTSLEVTTGENGETIKTFVVTLTEAVEEEEDLGCDCDYNDGYDRGYEDGLLESELESEQEQPTELRAMFDAAYDSGFDNGYREAQGNYYGSRTSRP